MNKLRGGEVRAANKDKRRDHIVVKAKSSLRITNPRKDFSFLFYYSVHPADLCN